RLLCFCFLFSFFLHPPPSSTLFPYTTLFRSPRNLMVLLWVLTKLLPLVMLLIGLSSLSRFRPRCMRIGMLPSGGRACKHSGKSFSKNTPRRILSALLNCVGVCKETCQQILLPSHRL